MIPKFRAWDKYRNEMYEVRSISFETEEIETDNEQITFETVIIMQSTGLHDKNGVEIYEGDILKLRDSYLAVYVVEWYKDKFMWVLRYQKDKNQYFPFYGITNAFLEDLELLGNVYETPELLEDVE